MHRIISDVELRHGATPPSTNSPRSGFKSRNWTQGYRVKKEWQAIWEMNLLASDLPRGCLRVHVQALLVFPRRQRRDAENYLPMISKPLGDALVNGGWLPDDTPEHYRFERLAFGRGTPETILTLRYTKDILDGAA